MDQTNQVYSIPWPMFISSLSFLPPPPPHSLSLSLSLSPTPTSLSLSLSLLLPLILSLPLSLFPSPLPFPSFPFPALSPRTPHLQTSISKHPISRQLHSHKPNRSNTSPNHAAIIPPIQHDHRPRWSDPLVTGRPAPSVWQPSQSQPPTLISQRQHELNQCHLGHRHHPHDRPTVAYHTAHVRDKMPSEYFINTFPIVRPSKTPCRQRGSRYTPAGAYSTTSCSCPRATVSGIAGVLWEEGWP